MPYIRIWVHIVWSTKNRQPFLNKEIRQNVFKHISENAKSKGIILNIINGFDDHVHCLVGLNEQQNIATIAQLLKGESSFWINKNNLCKEKFGWQDEYFAVSVSESQFNTVRNYIFKQEEHHAKKTWQQEYDEFIKNYNFENLE
ncbi:MAG: IS200/IS605 family transposase [Chitinophagaceae bacterium]|nr:IS200/IS605 family transposase [Chitinophagaceae bacterium]